MTAEYPQGDEPLIPMPALSLPALRQAVATVAPSRLPEFFQDPGRLRRLATGQRLPHPPLLPALGRRHRHRRPRSRQLTAGRASPTQTICRDRRSGSRRDRQAATAVMPDGTGNPSDDLLDDTTALAAVRRAAGATVANR
jgi:hypothetical protein